VRVVGFVPTPRRAPPPPPAFLFVLRTGTSLLDSRTSYSMRGTLYRANE
jgi:hypothetical protein